MEEFINSYIMCLLWSSNDELGEPLDLRYGFKDISVEAMKCIKRDCENFLYQANKLVKELDEYDLSELGHDFWLTRNGHGVGFWDGDYSKEVGEAFNKLAYSFGEVYPYVGGDSLIYLE